MVKSQGSAISLKFTTINGEPWSRRVSRSRCTVGVEYTAGPWQGPFKEILGRGMPCSNDAQEAPDGWRVVLIAPRRCFITGSRLSDREGGDGLLVRPRPP